MDVYAVIQTGGKQYRVSPGDVISVEKLPAQPGELITIDRVYLVARDGQISTGSPGLPNTSVVARVLSQDRAEKLIIFKHKRRTGYRRTMGHRQQLTELQIVEVVHEGVSLRGGQEKKNQRQRPAAPVKAAPAKKEGRAKQRPTPEKNTHKAVGASQGPDRKEPSRPDMTAAAADPPVSEGASAAPAALPEETPGETPDDGTATRSAVSTPPQRDQPKPAAPPPVPEASPVAPAALPEETPARKTAAGTTVPTPPPAPPEIDEPKPVVPTPVPEATSPVTESVQETGPDAVSEPAPDPEQPSAPAKPPAESRPRAVDPAERRRVEAAPQKRVSWRTIAAVIAALALAVLLLVLGRHWPSPAPAALHESVNKPASKKAIGPKPRVREVTIKETAPLVKPAAPAQPPD